MLDTLIRGFELKAPGLRLIEIHDNLQHMFAKNENIREYVWLVTRGKAKGITVQIANCQGPQVEEKDGAGQEFLFRPFFLEEAINKGGQLREILELNETRAREHYPECFEE